jgi:ParB-like chromosome segregation protein Spo0J
LDGSARAAGAASRTATRVALRDLRGAVCPRSTGVDEAHARLLAESRQELPPILVQTRSLRVIDGMHRLRAADLLGLTHITAIMVDEDDKTAFVTAITANVTHGLPLSLPDRRAAAAEIITLHPDWSDRRIAKTVGLSGKTIGSLRRNVPATPQPSRRTGADGRVRPVSAAHGRRAARKLLEERPDSSVREVAAAAGISPATARDVRNGLRGRVRSEQGQDKTDDTVRSITPAGLDERTDYATVLRNLSHDPSLRYSDVGRVLLRLLHNQPPTASADDIVASLPPHCLPLVASLSRHYAARWSALAETAERRSCTEAA